MSKKIKTSYFIKFILVIIFSTIVAIGMAMLIDSILGGSRLFGLHIVGAYQSNLMVSVFALTFLLCVTGLAYKPASKSTPDTLMGKQKVLNKKITITGKKIWQNWNSLQKNDDRNKIKDKGFKKAKKKKFNVQDKLLKGTKKSEKIKTEELNFKEKENGTFSEKSQEIKNINDQNSDKIDTQEEKLKINILNFLKEALEGSNAGKAKMDNFNKFGVSLYLAGACETMSQNELYQVSDRSKVLAEAVRTIGLKKSHATAFSEKYEEYLTADSRYMQMFQAGRYAMNMSLTERNTGPKLFNNAMVEWNKPKPKELQTEPITILFTDIAGSTALTQSLGDEGAQKVVRAHNRIVREALTIHAGKEVKHTGDGIMASFSKTTNAVEGAIFMQLEALKHNQIQPALPLHLKIGLNTGAPITEDDDLFGTVVQLSARIVDKASADKIYVSEIVRGLCAGKKYKFKKLGGFSMKGFDNEINLFEILWK